MPSNRQSRALRGLAAAGFSTFVSLLLHTAAGGVTPGPVGIIAPLILSAFVCVLAAGRRVTVLRLIISVALSQIIFHGLFVLGTAQAAGGAGASGAFGAQAGHAGHSGALSLLAAAPAGHAGHGRDMTLAHVIAGIITVAVLLTAASAIARLGDAGAFVLARIVGTLPAAPDAPSPRLPSAEHAPAWLPPVRLGVFPGAHGHRGPPSAATA